MDKDLKAFAEFASSLDDDKDYQATDNSENPLVKALFNTENFDTEEAREFYISFMVHKERFMSSSSTYYIKMKEEDKDG
jgi:hypothetical protein